MESIVGHARARGGGGACVATQEDAAQRAIAPSSVRVREGAVVLARRHVKMRRGGSSGGRTAECVRVGRGGGARAVVQGDVAAHVAGRLSGEGRATPEAEVMHNRLHARYRRCRPRLQASLIFFSFSFLVYRHSSCSKSE